MFVLFILGAAVCYGFEAAGNPNIASQNVETKTSALAIWAAIPGGGALWSGAILFICHGNHRCQLRCGQLHARFVHAYGWFNSTLKYPAR